MLGYCVRRLGTTWLRASAPPGSNLLIFLEAESGVGVEK